MLELKHISFAVPSGGGTKEIIRDVDLTLPSGKLTVITGPNGGGKSTLARLIAGIEKVSSGRIVLTERTSRTRASRNGRKWGSALPFSSRSGSRGSM